MSDKISPHIYAMYEWSWVFSDFLGTAYGYHINGYDVNISCPYGSKPFFYFLDNIKQEKLTQDCYYTRTDHSTNSVYRKDFNPKDAWGDIWTMPPIKQYYQKDNPINNQKPILVVNNKHTMEWYKKPYNFLDLGVLKSIFSLFGDKYDIYYIRHNKEFHLDDFDGYHDNVDTVPFGDYDLIENEFPNVVTIYDFMKDYNLDYNESQCVIMSKSDKHISVSGGNAVLSSLFSKDNVIYTHPNDWKNTAVTRGIWHTDSWLSLLNNSAIYGVNDFHDLVGLCEDMWL